MIMLCTILRYEQCILFKNTYSEFFIRGHSQDRKPAELSKRTNGQTIGETDRLTKQKTDRRADRHVKSSIQWE